jgi:membrane-associated phospholipid phosphatase
MPSGHSSFTTLFFLLVFYEYFYKPDFQSRLGKLCAKIGQFLCFFIIVNMLISRLYFGAHSINQIINGSLFGLTLFFVGNLNISLAFLYKQNSLC